jgi:hypothetical protein
LLTSPQDPETAELLPDIALLDAKIAEAITALKEAESSGDKRRAKERKEDLMRLKRVEQIYVRVSVTETDQKADVLPAELCSPCIVGMGSCVVEASIGHSFSKYKHAAAILNILRFPPRCRVALVFVFLRV